jgi:uncharacterized small protein (DUF1192 family)
VIAGIDVWEDAQRDIRELPSRALQVAAMNALKALRENPWAGAELRDRIRVGDLTGLRRVAFDEPGWEDKPRYRVVYRNEPDDAVVDVLAVIAVGLRERLAAYREAAARLRAERRRRLLGR